MVNDWQEGSSDDWLQLVKHTLLWEVLYILILFLLCVTLLLVHSIFFKKKKSLNLTELPLISWQIQVALWTAE
jgi:hypothetical protein